MHTKRKCSLMSYYKHLCNYCPSQEKKIYYETCTKKGFYSTWSWRGLKDC